MPNPTKATKTTKTDKAKEAPKKAKLLSPTSRPDNMSLREWQRNLRIQYGETQEFVIKNTGEHILYADFLVSSLPNTRYYKVAMHNAGLMGNTCTCMDFRTNRLGVCKHISAVWHKVKSKHGVKKAMKSSPQRAYTELYVDYTDGRNIKIRFGTNEEAAYRVWAEKYFNKVTQILFAGARSVIEDFLREAKAISEDFRCQQDVLDLIIKERDNDFRQKKLESLVPQGIESPYFDDLLKVKLYDYQKEGVLFAAKAGRSLIADEMGLGKTIQAIAASEMYRQEFGVSRVLIVCPTSLKYQWKSEIEKFTNNTVQVIEGNYLKRIAQYKASEAFYTIITYNVVASDLKDLQKAGFDMLILDEAQRIKNWETKASIAIKQLQTAYAIVLTGTPLENRLQELYSIVQVIDQFHLEPLYQFIDRYQFQDENGRVTGFTNLKEISGKLANVMLRRNKQQVLTQLPGRSDKILYVPMTEQQANVHRGCADEVAQLVNKWKRHKFLSEQDRRKLLVLLSQMRMVCDSTYITDPTTRHHTKIQELFCIIEEALTNNPNEKIVIFSQWERMTSLVAEELAERSIGFRSLHGGVPSAKRGQLLEDFKNDPNCNIFLSTDAGGVGLNLQSASYVINLDIPWNPAVLEQRIARVYRLGQTQHVSVINMVSIHTIEHRMLGVLEFKSSMAKGVLDDGDDTIFLSESRFKQFMTSVESITTGTPKPQSDTNATEDAERIGDNNALTPEEEASNLLLTQEPETINESDIEIPQDSNEKVNVNQVAYEANDLEDVPPVPQTTPASEPTTSSAIDDPQVLLRNGLNFLGGLAKTLQNPESTRQLVNSITEKNPQDGKTYLKIPVEDTQLVENALNLLGALFKNFGK